MRTTLSEGSASRFWATVIAAWGVAGTLALLGQALWRLTPLALEPLGTDLPAWQAAIYAGWVVFNAYAEGYRGFQRSFSPRVVARAMHLGRHPRPLHVLLAPAFCMSLFHATRRSRIVSWCILVGVVGLVMLMHHVSQPWRGIIDGGVVVGLVWGALAIAVFFARALMGRPVPAKDDLPPGSP